jgi:alpha-glucosidase
MDEVFPLFARWGVAGVKIDFMDRDDQWMVGFYHRAAERAAANKLLLNFHGAYKPTGMSRTWPNVLTYEGVLGLEYLKWSGRTTADHNTFLPFTRMLAGPLDYTPGGFRNVSPAEFRPRNIEPLVPNTRAHQLGLYVVFESALQMLADHPGAYEGQKELAFLKAVPAVWDETRGVAGRPGEYAVVARRSGQTWFLGGITNHDGRALEVPLDFLPAGDFTAEVYGDAGSPAATEVKSQKVTRTGKLSVRLAPTGGFAAILRPAR